MLFKLRTNIEWIVNKIERCKDEDAPDGDCDETVSPQEIQHLQDVIDDITKQLQTNEEDADTSHYIAEINKYISSFENYLQESQNTLMSLSGENFASLVKNRSDTGKAMTGGGNNLYGGDPSLWVGDHMDIYDNTSAEDTKKYTTQMGDYNTKAVAELQKAA